MSPRCIKFSPPWKLLLGPQPQLLDGAAQILGGCCEVFVRRQIRQKRCDSRHPHLLRMRHPACHVRLEENIAFVPLHIAFLCPFPALLQQDRSAQALLKAWLGTWNIHTWNLPSYAVAKPQFGSPATA
jgi:hypothetical protein